MIVLHSTVPSIPAGATYPFAESYMRHVFGTQKMIASVRRG